MAVERLEMENHSRDAEFNKVLHGKNHQERKGLLAMLQKDPTAKQAAVDEYFKHWDNKDAPEETSETRAVNMCHGSFDCGDCANAP